jgi:hypothetical protein
MADGVDIFVYLGGEQEVPRNVTHVRIDRSVKAIPMEAFYQREQLVSVETHDGIEKIEDFAFDECISLRGIKLPSVREIGLFAFHSCTSLTDVEFGKKLETVGAGAFGQCTSLQKKIKMPSVRTVGDEAFYHCLGLTGGVAQRFRCIYHSRRRGCSGSSSNPITSLSLAPVRRCNKSWLRLGVRSGKQY